MIQCNLASCGAVIVQEDAETKDWHLIARTQFNGRIQGK